MGVVERDMTARQSMRDRSRPSTAGRAEEATADASAEELLELLGDEYTRRVLDAITDRPRTGPAIAATADVSKATVYRRLERLEDAGLVASTEQLDPDGHHRKQFHAIVSALDFEVDQDGLRATVETERDCYDTERLAVADD